MEAAFETNLRCESCLQKVGPLLEEEPVVASWGVDLTDPHKVLKANLESPNGTERVIEILQQAGYSASLVEGAGEHELDHQNSFKLSTYKPLLLVMAYVFGATTLTEAIHGDFQWQRSMSYFMGFFFLGFAFFKLLNVSKFAEAFATYDLIAKRSTSYARLYPWIEVTLGLLFVTGTALGIANLVTALVMTIGLVGVLAALREERTIQCACLGAVFNLPMSVVTVVENSVMIAMALVMLVAQQLT